VQPREQQAPARRLAPVERSAGGANRPRRPRLWGDRRRRFSAIPSSIRS
jgi:hypothetical protein